MPQRSQPSTRSGVSLVVGGDSMIGAALAEDLRQSGKSVVATSRRGSKDCVYLDLARPDDFSLPAGVDVAYLCAAVARIEACARDPAGSRQVNVEAMVSLARRLSEAGAFVVFLSTNQVFDGEMPHVAVDTPPAPRTEYGRQKAEAERRIRQVAPESAIVRFGKVLPRVVPLFQDWHKALAAGRTIEPFSDMQMAPIRISFAVDVLQRVGERRTGGIFHACGDRDFSYDEIALRAARTWGCDASLVRAVEARASGRYVEFIPRHTTLDVTSLVETFGLARPSSESCLDESLASS